MLARREFLTMVAGSAAPSPAGFRRVTAWSEAEGLAAVQVRVEGRSSKVVRCRGPKDDLLLMIVLDVTGDLTLVDPARQAAVAEIEKLPAGVWVGLLRSQDGLRVLVDPTPDRAAVTTALLGAPVSGRAGLLETIEPAAGLATKLLRKTGVRTAVLYLTDSNISNYREDYTNPVINMSDSRDLSRRFPEALINEKISKIGAVLGETDAPVFVVHLAFLRDRLNEAYQTGLQQIAEATGGQAEFCRTQGDIATTIGLVFKKIQSAWALDVEIPPGTPRNFTVQLSGDAEARYRTRFVMRSGKE
jgi:hypothetical protein